MSLSLGIGLKIGSGGGASWTPDTPLNGETPNLWVKSGTRSGTTLPNSIGGNPVTILPMTALRTNSVSMADLGVTAVANTLWIVKCRFLELNASKVQGSYTSGHDTRFYFGTDAAKKWRFGWGSANGLTSAAGLQDMEWYTIIMYDKRMWLASPDLSLTDEAILNVIAAETPTVNQSAATWSGTEGNLNLGGYPGSPIDCDCEYALSYIGNITANVITWSRKFVLYGKDIYDTINADTPIVWTTIIYLAARYSAYGSDHMMNKGYSLLRDVSIYPRFIPNLQDGLQNEVTILPDGFVIAAVISGNATNYNLAPARLNIPYANFDKSDTTIWEDIVRSSDYYDAGNTYQWSGEELNRWNLVRKAKAAYDNIVFAKNDSNRILDLISYDVAVGSEDLPKVLQYIGENYYNYKIVFDKEYESDDLLYKYSTKQWFYQRDNFVFTMNPDGFIFYSENGGLTFPYIYEFADSAGIQMCHVFSNGIIHFATRTKYYYSTDKLKTVNEYKVQDADGNDYVIHTPVDPAYPGSYFSMVQSFPSFTLPDGREILIWGNYANSIIKGGASPVNLYYAINGSRPCIAYKFGVNPAYRDDGTDYGGAVGNDLGDPLNPLYCRHIHSITYNYDLDEYYMCTGDSANENHWLKGTYNSVTDIWTWTNIIINQSTASRWKTGCLWYHTDGYIYFVSDSTEAPYDYGIFKVLPEDIGSSGDCTTLAVFDNTASGFRIDGTNLVGRSAVEGDFIFYSKNLVDISTLTLTKPDANRDVIVGVMNDKNTDGYYKFNVSGTTGTIDYVNNVAVLGKFK